MYLVSACLAGMNCRYDGSACKIEAVAELVRQGKAIPVCPEQLGGLPTPRSSCEILMGQDGQKKVIGKDGRDCTKEFLHGAQKALEIAQKAGVTDAILKSKSPSCGCGGIYDGTFSGGLTAGNGMTADLLLKNGIKVRTEQELS